MKSHSLLNLVAHAIVAALAASLVLDTADAKQRGAAGTTTRSEYCQDQYDTCKRKGDDECLLDQMQDIIDQTRLNTCKAGVEHACGSYFVGSSSPCMTQARIKSVQGVYGPAVAAERPSPPPLPAGMENNTDRMGGDFTSFEATANVCQNYCVKDKRCKAWTYVRARVQGPRPVCYLKDRVPAARSDACCISGIVLRGPAGVHPASPPSATQD